jgi:hypothetical protein
MSVFNANLQITKSKVKNGEIVDLEINGQNIELGSEMPMDANKAQTIDVSTYTDPVAITPSSGKKGMKKATVTLSNIPQAGANAYAWKLSIGGGDGGYRYFDFAESPADKTAANTHKALRVYNATQLEVEQNAFEVYTKTDTTHFSFEADGDEYTATRDATKDITLWGE